MARPAVVIQPLLAPARPLGAADAPDDPRQLRLPQWPASVERRDEPFGRMAAIDIGSNSIHMIVVAPQPNGAYRVLGREREMVRLGKTGLGEGKLSETAIANGLEALLRMTTMARLKGADRVVAVATSAVREAANGMDFLGRVKAHTGLDVQLLTGAEEGRVIFRAMREVVDLGPGGAVVVDVGGGSTEWIEVQAGELAGVASLPLGSLRCAVDLEGDPPRPGSIARLRESIRARLAEEVPRDPSEPRHPDTAPPARVIATSGTALCCADLVDFFGGRAEAAASGLREVRAKELTQLVARLRRLERRKLAELPPVGGPRSDSLMAGAILLQELIAHAGVDRFQVSDRALRDGLVLEALGQPIPEALQPGDLRRRQVLQLAEQAQSVLRHNQQTARLALRLFDVTASLHSFGAREREWLEYAALLHDIGYSVHYRNHHKHAYYLIANAGLAGFDPPEIDIIAHLARYHRGPLPKLKHPTFAALKPWQQKTIRRLAVLLRMADALDRTHASRVEEVYGAIGDDRVRIEVVSPYQVGLELEAAREHRADFKKIFGARLSLRQGLETA
ncbi:MAG TPA: Ppx/GppA phosphatase family protein [Thermoanaerobaculia bacterium]|nr:Ppx/GppA phosphatase family protein [Thermoanaerobaculia bacterium]